MKASVCAFDDNTIYSVGGIDISKGKTSDIFMYSVLENKWSKVLLSGSIKVMPLLSSHNTVRIN